MSKISGGSAIAMTAAAGAVVVGGALWFENGRKGTPAVATETSAALTPEAQVETSTEPTNEAPKEAVAQEEPKEQVVQEVVEAEPAPEAEPIPQAAPEPRTLAFDEVRREEDGLTIIAGQAEPGAVVEVLQNGTSLTKVTADGQGKFAAIAMIAPDGQGHVLSLVQTVDGVAHASADQIILAPLEVPVQVADPAPESTEEPAKTQDVDTAALVEAPVEAATEEADAETDVAVAQEAEEPKSTQTLAETAAEVVPTQDAVQDAPVEAETQDAAPDQTATVQVDEAPAQEPMPTVPETASLEAEPEAPETSGAAAQETPEVTKQAEEPSTDLAAQTAVDTPVTPEPKQEEPVAKAPVEQPSVPADTPQVVVLKSTQDGVELLNVPRPEAMENVALDTISYSDEGDVQLAGRAQSEARNVRVYLDNRSIVSLNVDEQGRWRGDLPDVDEGIYTLRVDEVAADGSVTSRVETPFKRESPEVLAEAAAAADGPLKKITVQKGATLWAIAQERYGDGLLYVNVFRANAKDIRDPNLIYPGQVFDLPD